MPLLSATDSLRLKLEAMPKADLEELCSRKGSIGGKLKGDLVKQLVQSPLSHSEVDCYVRQKFPENIIKPRQQLISTADLWAELGKVREFAWGAVQGGLDAKIQRQFIRVYPRYDQLLQATQSDLSRDVTSYVICTWYNYWTTVLIEETIYLHPRVVPSLRRNVAGLDFFFDTQPFDLKVTYLPEHYQLEAAVREPKQLIVWLYENQGEERFSSHNRFYVVLFDQTSPSDSWKLKREFELLNRKIQEFFDQETVSPSDEIVFSYKKRGSFSAISKLLLIVR